MTLFSHFSTSLIPAQLLHTQHGSCGREEGSAQILSQGLHAPELIRPQLPPRVSGTISWGSSQLLSGVLMALERAGFVATGIALTLGARQSLDLPFKRLLVISRCYLLNVAVLLIALLLRNSLCIKCNSGITSTSFIGAIVLSWTQKQWIFMVLSAL
jgi:hypothetical protein